VGSRKNTEYGKNVLKKIFSEIPYQNVSIISGGAYGIDSLAHELALQYNLHTIAVFGCGIDVIYPKTNAKLFENILASGG
jgi:DNA processing protein dprA